MSNSVVGIRQLIRKGAEIRDSVLMGADSYPSARPEDADSVPLGIGEGTTIRRAIVDKDAQIGRNVVIRQERERHTGQRGESTMIETMAGLQGSSSPLRGLKK